MHFRIASVVNMTVMYACAVQHAYFVNTSEIRCNATNRNEITQLDAFEYE